MILQALTDYYEILAEKKQVTRQGWCQAKVSFALNLNEDGSLKGVIPLKEEKERGKKKIWVPQIKEVPQMVSRSSGVSANFLCDNSKYMLGVDAQGCSKRTKECFTAAKEKHLSVLGSLQNKMSHAILGFFQTWEPEKAMENPKLQDVWEEVTDGGNLIFTMGMEEAQEELEIKEVWQRYFDKDEKKEMGTCLVTGKQAEISRIHAVIKGVVGAQSSGAALVSFNAPAFESYGKEQSYNAPVSTYAAFAYTTSLNFLLSQRDYVFQLGETTIVFWAKDGEEAYQKAFGFVMEPELDNQETIRGIFENLKKQKAIDFEDMELNPDQRFYILGLAPNAARIAVRFFYQDNFGNIIRNIQRHYERMSIVKPSWEAREYFGIWRMLQETVNQNSKEKKPTPNMPGAVMRAILSDGRYPQELYSSTLMRIRAEQGKISCGRAAIIKAFLIKNYHLQKGENFVGLNEDSRDESYVLGRIFAVLEAIQEEANPGINATIRDRYFNAACAMPESIFPILMKLKNSHIRKLENEKRGLKIYFEKILTELTGRLDKYPKRLTLEEQGKFILGYYHQLEKRYEKKEEK